jgi:N utilization substance protein A
MPDDTGAVVRLFAQEVPEIAAGTVEIKAIARKPGYRSKLAVYSHDPHVNGIAACVGVRRFRLKNVVDALGGERIDIASVGLGVSAAEWGAKLTKAKSGS